LVNTALKIEQCRITLEVPLGTAPGKGEAKYFSALATQPTHTGLTNPKLGFNLMACAQPNQPV
jgi:hypothetical protein